MTEPPSHEEPATSWPRAPVELQVPAGSAPAPRIEGGRACVVDRWGPVVALLLTVAVFLFDILLQMIVVGVFAGVQVATGGIVIEDSDSLEGVMNTMLQDHAGLILSLSLVLTAPVAILAILGLAKLRGPVRQYLALDGFSWKSGLLWTVACAVFLTGFEIVARLLERPPVPDFMFDAYTTAGSLPLLYLAIAVAAPVFEELLFRGFLLPSFAESRLGAVGGVLLSSAIFAVIHLQYDLFDMSAVFGLGVLLGAARLHSRSTTLPLLLHAAINLVATVQTGWVIGGG